MIEIGPMPAGGSTTLAPASRSRLTERHVLALGLALSGAFVLLTATTAIGALSGGGAWWATVHLALAGAATVAIGTFMPHFAVTLAGTRPRPAGERVTALVLLAAGALMVVVGRSHVGTWAVGLGAAAMLSGIGIVARQTVAPLADPLARRHPIVTVLYGAALVQLAAGIALGALGSLGIQPIAGAWLSIRPAHVWLSLFGAISLTIFATLVYLAPTVLGARIRPSAALMVGATGMLVGPVVAAAGFVLDQPFVAVSGVGLTLAGALGQLAYVADAVRRRGPFSSEHDWRRVASGHLVAGPLWYTVAVAAALFDLLAGGQLRGWTIGLLAIPMVAGWMLQELIGSWTHLVPSVTPGDGAQHARQRRVLAAVSRSRLVALNAGVAAAWAGAWAAVAPVAVTGAVLAGAAVVASVVLMGRSLAIARY